MWDEQKRQPLATSAIFTKDWEYCYLHTCLSDTPAIRARNAEGALVTTYTYTTEINVPGPWLLDSTALEALDDILLRFWSDHRREQAAVIEEDLAEKAARFGAKGIVFGDDERAEIRERLEYVLLGRGPRIEILLGKGKSLRTTSLKEASDELDATTERPRGIRASLDLSQVTASLTVGSGVQENSLTLSVIPQADAQAKNLYGALRQWVLTYQAPSWQRAWVHFGSAGIWLSLFFVLIFGATLGGVRPSDHPPFREAARALLTDGIDPGEQSQALELLLQHSADLFESSPPVMRRWYMILVVASLVAAITLSISPPVILGMGDGGKLIKRWRWWLRVVGVVVPGALVTTVILPYMVDLIGRIL